MRAFLSTPLSGIIPIRFWSALFLLLLTVVISAETRTEHVVIVVMDGARYSETWGDAQRQHIPRIAADLASQGVVLTRFTNRGPTTTNPGHTALCTGIYQDIDNSGRELPSAPSFFQYLRRERNLPANATWVIAAKDKLAVLADASAPGWQGRFQPAHDCGNAGNGSGYRSDAVTMQRALKALTTHAPTAMLINFLGPDAQGHGNRWNGYLAAIREVDGYAAELWTTIQNDTRLKDRTALFVTNDHGRHLDGVRDGFISHGCDCDGCRHLLCVALGPDFKRGVEIATPYHLPDLTATTAALLKIAMPTGKGTVMRDLFSSAP